MIKNERQCRITKAQADKLERALAQLAEGPTHTARVHPLLRKAEAQALQSQLADLRTELQEYEALRAGKRRVLELGSFDDFPRALIQARIASGLTQEQLAARLRLKPQQIQRYEATGYSSASLARVMQVVRALDLRIQERVLLPGSATLRRGLSENSALPQASKTS